VDISWVIQLTFVKVYHNYDYVIIDSSSGLAADDTTSWAPKLMRPSSSCDCRVDSGDAEIAGLLYNRQVNVPGVILNY
jgi:hypothetical protein